MNFKTDFPELFQFFAGYFPDSDFENLTDEQVVANYIVDCNKSEKSKSELNETRKELSKLLENVDDYWQQVGREANRYFDSSTDTLEWLSMINQHLQP